MSNQLQSSSEENEDESMPLKQWVVMKILTYSFGWAIANVALYGSPKLAEAAAFGILATFLSAIIIRPDKA